MTIKEMLKKKYGIPYIVAIRYSDLCGRGRNMSVHKKHCLDIMLHAEKVIFISNAYKENVWSRYADISALQQIKERTVVITNGIDDYFLNNIAPIGCHKPNDSVIRLMAIGKIDNRKNPLITLKACDILIKKGYKVESTEVVNAVQAAWKQLDIAMYNDGEKLAE